MNKTISTLGTIADREDSDEEARLRHRILIFSGVLMSGGGLIWGLIAFSAGLYWQSTIPFGYILLTIINLYLLNLFRNFDLARTVQISASLILPFAFQWVLGGFSSSGGVMLWSSLALIGSLTIDEKKGVWIWSGLFVILTVFSGFLEPNLVTPAAIDYDLARTVFFVINIVVVTMVVFFLTVFFVRGREKALEERKQAERELIIAKDQSDEIGKVVAEKNEMLEALSRKLAKYLSPQIYDSIFSGEQSVVIETKRKKLTVFFSDIVNFTGTTERLESEELTNLLNHYLTEMSEIALQHGATIDKYVGDAIIAFFGDPESLGTKEDAVACVKMALAMQNRMDQLQSIWTEMGLEQPFQQRIGINTGYCSVGNFGSESRMDYTIIGNEVNLAARLESAADIGGILLTNETYSLVKHVFDAEEGEPITAKGLTRSIRTFRVKGLLNQPESEKNIHRSEIEGLSLKFDPTKMTSSGGQRAALELEQVLVSLKNWNDCKLSAYGTFQN